MGLFFCNEVFRIYESNFLIAPDSAITIDSNHV